MNYYKQCKLVKEIGIGSFKTKMFETAWVPEYLAKKGKIVIVKKSKMDWQIEEVYDIRRSEIDISRRERDYLHQREASDI